MVQCNIRDHGAVGDGATDDTSAVQAAIDACAAGGSGTVLVQSGGTFRIGSVTLRSFVDLHVERGATLAASPDFAEYSVRHPGVVNNDWSTGDGWAGIETSVMIDADGARDIAITGGGVIDGGGRHFVEEDLGPIYRMDEHRPFTVYLRNCSGVTIRDVAIVDGALWTLRLSRCDDVVIHGIRIHNDLKLPNSDGIDLDACRRVRISDCDIVAGDDAICLKACAESVADGRVCEDVTVTGCTITTTSSALILGSENQTAIRNVVFSSCVVWASNRGLSIRAHEQGDVDNILFSDITVETRFFDDRWWGRGEPIYLTAVATRERAGRVRNIRFRNILARGRTACLSSPALPEASKGSASSTCASISIAGPAGPAALLTCERARRPAWYRWTPTASASRTRLTWSCATARWGGPRRRRTRGMRWSPSTLPGSSSPDAAAPQPIRTETTQP